MRTAVVGLVALALLWCVAPTANAEIVTRRDPQASCSQRPALDVKRATFNYGEDRSGGRSRWRRSVESTPRSSGGTQGTRDGVSYDVMLVTKYDSEGVNRVTGYWSITERASMTSASPMGSPPNGTGSAESSSSR